ncbi:hypothetical protein GCM10007423_29770 [Dyadobacter endophyticus]|uniref:Auto-transporter adhesin head GIN domain-containing protein n=1 Tax=Dyadobacter endophyticus TaxID=1749036 RepID=A0ABQ1YUG6_9BACT|nr:hypothetical protein [Dyadobacter endophyticus]GGH37034.1 hypothetical protein GCM10007423_29770 [Dyadobacter endophyticus]
MKTSNILLIVTVSLFFLVTLSSNLALKSQFDKIDKNDAFYGFSRHPIKPFQYIKLLGKDVGLTEIRQGPVAEIRMITLPKYLRWDSSGDTLILTYTPEVNQGYRPRGGTYGSLPSFYVITPSLQGIILDNVRCKVRNFKFGDLTVQQKGDGLFFAGSSIDNLTANVAANGYLKLDQDNQIGRADITVRDSSVLSADKDMFKLFNAKIDSSAYISMPGSMLKKMMTGNKIAPR